MRVYFGICLAVLAFISPIHAKQPTKDARISIIIDDLGYGWEPAQRVIALPGPIACAVLPHTRYSEKIANVAHSLNKEVLLHLPMETKQHDKDPGPGKLEISMPSLELQLTVDYDLETVPHAVGINNHMGSALTEHRSTVDVLMTTLKNKNKYFFVDSLTSSNSVVALSANTHNIPYLVRDIFLDNVASEEVINAQFDQLLQLARKKGWAIAIGHPYPETLSVLERRLPTLTDQKIKLISLSSMLEYTNRKAP